MAKVIEEAGIQAAPTFQNTDAQALSALAIVDTLAAFAGYESADRAAVDMAAIAQRLLRAGRKEQASVASAQAIILQIESLGDTIAAELGIFTRAFDGFIVEEKDVTVIERDNAIFLQVEAEGGGDLTCRFGGVFYTLDCTPSACEVELDVGTADVPLENFVFVTEAAGVLTLDQNTTGFPTTAFCAIATVAVKTAALTAADGAIKVHKYGDHLVSPDDQGIVAHINAWIRDNHALWLSGVAPSDLVVDDPDAYISTTAGIVRQVHRDVMSAQDMQAGDKVYVINEPTDPWLEITSFDQVTQDASGGPINNKFMVIVVGCIRSDKTGDCHLFMNLPTGTYVVQASAEIDNDRTAVDTIPSILVGTACLIARYVFKAKDSGAWEQILKVDLRGSFPGGAGGGSGSVGDTHPVPDTTTLVHNNADPTMTVGVDAGNITPGNRRDIIMADADVNLALVALAAAVMADNAIVRGDGVARGVQKSGVLIDDSDNVSGADLTTTQRLLVDEPAAGDPETVFEVKIDAVALAQIKKDTSKFEVNFTGHAMQFNAVDTWTATFVSAGAFVFSEGGSASTFTVSVAGNITLGSGTGIASLSSGVLSASTAPAFTDFTNAQHDHGAAATGGTFAHDNLTGGTIANHDTGATGAELDTLTDGVASDADALHAHPKIATECAVFHIDDPLAGDIRLLKGIPKAATLKYVSHITDTGTVDFNIEARPNAAPLSAGEDIWAGEEQATSSSANTSTFDGTDAGAITARDFLYVAISAVASTPTVLTLYVEWEVD